MPFTYQARISNENTASINLFYKLSVAELLLQVALLKDMLEKILLKAAVVGSGNI